MKTIALNSGSSQSGKIKIKSHIMVEFSVENGLEQITLKTEGKDIRDYGSVSGKL